MNIETNGTYVRISATILSPQELAELVAVVSYMLWNNNRNKKMGKFGKGEPRPENEFGTGPVEEYLNHLEKHRNVATHKPVITCIGVRGNIYCSRAKVFYPTIANNSSCFC